MTVDGYHPDLTPILEAVEIHSPTKYTFMGEPRDFSGEMPAVPQSEQGLRQEPGGLTPEGTGEAAAPAFLPLLEHELYARLYTRPAAPGSGTSNVLAQREYISALSAANNGRGTWEPGWKVVSVDADGRVAVSRDDVTFWVTREGLRTARERILPGDTCRVRVGKEMRYLMPGFYFAIGDGAEREGRDTTDPLVRIYWNLTAAGALAYIERATALFNAASIPFRSKVLADPAAYMRADAGVLYFERRYFNAARALILDIHRTISTGLREEVPLFTKRLANGLGLAEDPKNGMSFGQSRCKIVARGLWSCFVQGVSTPEERLAALKNAFRKGGLDPERPFLDVGSTDVYFLTKPAPAAPGEPRKIRRQGRTGLRGARG